MGVDVNMHCKATPKVRITIYPPDENHPRSWCVMRITNDNAGAEGINIFLSPEQVIQFGFNVEEAYADGSAEALANAKAAESIRA